MKLGEMFPSDYIKHDDLPEGQSVKLVITGIEMGEVGQGKEAETKPIMSFKGQEKKLVLNKTNGSAIAYLYGEDADAWIGETIFIKRATTDFAGKIVDCVRVDIETAKAQGGGNTQAAFANSENPAPSNYGKETAALIGDSDFDQNIGDKL